MKKINTAFEEYRRLLLKDDSLPQLQKLFFFPEKITTDDIENYIESEENELQNINFLEYEKIGFNKSEIIPMVVKLMKAFIGDLPLLYDSDNETSDLSHLSPSKQIEIIDLFEGDANTIIYLLEKFRLLMCENFYYGHAIAVESFIYYIELLKNELLDFLPIADAPTFLYWEEWLNQAKQEFNPAIIKDRNNMSPLVTPRRAGSKIYFKDLFINFEKYIEALSILTKIGHLDKLNGKWTNLNTLGGFSTDLKKFKKEGFYRDDINISSMLILEAVYNSFGLRISDTVFQHGVKFKKSIAPTKVN